MSNKTNKLIDTTIRTVRDFTVLLESDFPRIKKNSPEPNATSIIAIMKKTTPQTMTSRLMSYLPLFSALLILMILSGLSIWQLNRGFEKNHLQAQLASQQTRSILSEADLQTAGSHDLNYRKIELMGHFLNEKTFLLDNQIYEGQVGYHVLVPFQWKPKHWILVNRGWIKAPNNRNERPIVEPIFESLNLIGTLRIPTANPMIKSMLESGNITWPLRIQKIDLNALTTLVGHKSGPYVFFLEAESPAVLTPVPLPETWLTPERHYGYAAQWFLLAIAWLVIMICIAKRKY